MSQLAVLIVPPAEDMAQVETVRRRFDHRVDAVPAHITLVFPFEHESADAALIGHVNEVASGVRAFGLELKGVTCSSDHHLFLLIDQGADEVRDLHDRLYSGLLRPLLSDQVFTPHVTVGRFATSEGCAEAMKAVEALGLEVRTKAGSVSIYDLTHIPYRATSEVDLEA